MLDLHKQKQTKKEKKNKNHSSWSFQVVALFANDESSGASMESYEPSPKPCLFPQGFVYDLHVVLLWLVEYRVPCGALTQRQTDM